MGDGFSRGPYRPTGLPPNPCSEAVEGVHEHCCHHDLPDDSEHAPGMVCCWCGDIYLPDYEPNTEHGEYKPKTTSHKPKTTSQKPKRQRQRPA